MNINRSNDLIGFKRDTYNDIEKHGIGPCITEHIPDNLHHGNHTKAIIGQINECDFYFGFENSITKKQMDNLSIKKNNSDSHSNPNCLSTDGDGAKQLFSCAKCVIIYNIIDGQKLHEKTMYMDKFFKELNNNPNENFEKIFTNNTQGMTFDMNDKKSYKKSYLSSFCECEGKFVEEIKKKFGKFPPFGYIIEFENRKLNKEWDDYTKKCFEQQKNIIKKFITFLNDDCPEIQQKSCLTTYDLYRIKLESKDKYNISLIPKCDPTKFEHRRGCLTIKFYIKDGKGYYIIVGDDKKRKYRRDIKKSQPDKTVTEKYKNEELSDFNNKIDIYYITNKNYDKKTDRKNLGGWMFLNSNDKQKILVNTEAINTKFIHKKYSKDGDDLIKSLRIVATLSNSNLWKGDGRKSLSTFSTDLEKLIKYFFEKIWLENREVYRRLPPSRPWKGTGDIYTHKDIPNITLLMDNCEKNLKRSSQAKNKTGTKSKKTKIIKQIKNIKLTKKDYNTNTVIEQMTKKTITDIPEIITEIKEEINEEIKSSDIKRNNFRKSQKDAAWDRQKGVCNNPHCKIKLLRSATNVDHKDGKRGNNNLKNCHYLCIPCHNIKTRKECELSTNNKVFEYSMMELDLHWRNKHINDIKNLMDSKPELTEQEEQYKIEIIKQWYHTLVKNKTNNQTLMK